MVQMYGLIMVFLCTLINLLLNSISVNQWDYLREYIIISNSYKYIMFTIMQVFSFPDYFSQNGQSSHYN